MVVLRVYGTPEIDAEVFDKVGKVLQATVGGILKISESQVNVYFPVDRGTKAIGERLTCLVDVSLNYSNEVRQRLVAGIEAILLLLAKRNITNCRHVHVSVKSEDGKANCFVSVAIIPR